MFNGLDIESYGLIKKTILLIKGKILSLIINNFNGKSFCLLINLFYGKNNKIYLKENPFEKLLSLNIK